MVTTHTSSHVFSNSTLVQILDDLCVRFIINLPTEEMHSVERVCFQIEEAQWYYEDFVRGHNPSLPTLNLRAFASKIFQHCPSLHEWKDSHEQAMNQFIAYKGRVPVRGAILLNHDLDQCVLVRGMKTSASWSFPRGKINQDEMDHVCAVREVLEETGFDATALIDSEWYIEQSIRSQNIRLYIIPGVPMDTQLAPRTRNEIGTIQWHYLSDLPTFSPKKKANGEALKMGKFYMVAPFLPHLRKWIQTEGAQWKLKHGAHAVEDTSPTDDEQNEQNGVVLGDSYSNTSAPYQDSSASLRSLLGIHAESARDPVTSQADAAAKLKSMLSIGPCSESAQPPNTAANGQILLSLLQSGSTPKKAEVQTRTNPPMTQPPVTPSRANVALVGVSPHSTVSHRSGVSRKPLSPLYDSPLAHPPAVYASPSHKASKPSATPPNFPPATAPVNDSGPYAQAAPPANALLTNLQYQPKPVAMTEQATALLKTLTSANPSQNQTQPQVVSPLDVFFPQQTKPAPDTQQKLSLLSILRGEGQPAAAPAPVQQERPVPVTPATPIEQLHAPPSRHQTPPVNANTKSAGRSPAARSPAAKREKQQHRTTPASPRAPRGQRIVKNGDFPKSTSTTRPLPVPPAKEAPQLLQAPPRRITPPLEPYMNSPINRTAGVSLTGIPPVLARATVDPLFDRRETADQEQQQTLLALFKKPSVSTLKQEVKVTSVPTASVSSPTEASGSATARLQAAVRKVQQSQKVPAMKTGGGVRLAQNSGERAATLPRSSHVPGGAEAFAKDAFLLSYLEGVAKGAGK